MLASEAGGLSADEAARRLVTFGPNRLAEPHVPLWRFLQQFRNPLIYALLTAGMISAGIGPGTEALVIVMVVRVPASPRGRPPA